MFQKKERTENRSKESKTVPDEGSTEAPEKTAAKIAGERKTVHSKRSIEVSGKATISPSFEASTKPIDPERSTIEIRAENQPLQARQGGDKHMRIIEPASVVKSSEISISGSSQEIPLSPVQNRMSLGTYKVFQPFGFNQNASIQRNVETLNGEPVLTRQDKISGEAVIKKTGERKAVHWGRSDEVFRKPEVFLLRAPAKPLDFEGSTIERRAENQPVQARQGDRYLRFTEPPNLTKSSEISGSSQEIPLSPVRKRMSLRTYKVLQPYGFKRNVSIQRNGEIFDNESVQASQIVISGIATKKTTRERSAGVTGGTITEAVEEHITVSGEVSADISGEVITNLMREHKVAYGERSTEVFRKATVPLSGAPTKPAVTKQRTAEVRKEDEPVQTRQGGQYSTSLKSDRKTGLTETLERFQKMSSENNREFQPHSSGRNANIQKIVRKLDKARLESTGEKNAKQHSRSCRQVQMVGNLKLRKPELAGGNGSSSIPEQTYTTLPSPLRGKIPSEMYKTFITAPRYSGGAIRKLIEKFEKTILEKGGGKFEELCRSRSRPAHLLETTTWHDPEPLFVKKKAWICG